VVLMNANNEEIRMLLPAVQKMKNKSEEEDEIGKSEKVIPTSLSQLTKRSKKTKDVNSMLKKMLTEYGK
ncbi:hypothetical protein L4C33_22325, partial [Vibrio makurazakiensis]